MKIINLSIQKIGFLFTLLLLSACVPAVTSTPVPAEPEETSTSVPVIATDAASALPYQPVSPEVCQILQEDASQSLGLTFTVETDTPFTDYASGETGLGCTLTAATTGASISDPNEALTKLVNGFIGWEEDSTKYGAGGPTGAATGLTRDAGLLLVSVEWEPSADANCPSDQPIDACVLTPEQKLYKVTIQAAMK